MSETSIKPENTIDPEMLKPGRNKYEHGRKWHGLKEIIRAEQPVAPESWITAEAHRRWPHMIPGGRHFPMQKTEKLVDGKVVHDPVKKDSEPVTA